MYTFVKSNKMKIEIITTVQTIEEVNLVLSQAKESLERNPNIRESYGLPEKSIERMELFRKKLIHSLVNQS